MRWKAGIPSDYHDVDEIDVKDILLSTTLERHFISSQAANVDKAHVLRQLDRNIDPRTGARLRPRGRRLKGHMYGLTLPKEFSIVELLGIDPRLEEVSSAAARQCLLLTELLVAPADDEPDGHTPAEVLAVAVPQRLTRSGDYPQSHLHLNVFPVARCPDGKWRWAELGEFRRCGELLQAYFQCGAAFGAAGLGYRVQPVQDSFTFVGFPEQLVNRFSYRAEELQAPRPKQAPRPAERLEPILQRWLAEIPTSERDRLQTLSAQAAPEVSHFGVAVEAALQELVGAEFTVAARDLATASLKRCLGCCPPKPTAVARLAIAGEVQGFILNPVRLGGELCCTTPSALEAEARFLSLLRDCPSAKRPWLPTAALAAWWSTPLKLDRSRVAALSGPISRGELDELLRLLGPEAISLEADGLPSAAPAAGPDHIVVILGADGGRSRLVAEAVQDVVARQGRVLLVAGAGHRPCRDLLQQWRREAALNLYTPSSALPLSIEIPTRSAMKVALSAGMPEAVVARSRSGRRPIWLCPAETIAERNQRVRARRKRPGEATTEVLSLTPGLPGAPRRTYLHFRRQRGHIARGASLEILVELEQLVCASDVSGKLVIVPWNFLESADIQTGGMIQVSKGECVMVLRDCVFPDGSRVRAGRRFAVAFLPQKGGIGLPDGRVLPPGFGQVNYGYCADLEDLRVKAEDLVCLADDLPAVVGAGWTDRARSLVVCAASLETAAQAVARHLPHVAHHSIFVDGSLAEDWRKQRLMAADKDLLVAKEKPGGFGPGLEL